MGIINVLPFVDEAASDAQRTEKFPWALGGYAGFARVPNLGPTHRRFMTENMAYAILPTAPALFYTNVPILCTAVASHLVVGDYLLRVPRQRDGASTGSWASSRRRRSSRRAARHGFCTGVCLPPRHGFCTGVCLPHRGVSL